MKVLAFTRYERIGASSRQRLYQYVPLLHETGIEVDVQPLFREDYLKRLYAGKGVDWIAVFCDYLKRVLNLLRIPRYDLVWIEKELFPNLPAWTEQILKRCGVPYVVDFDDAMFHIYDMSTNPLQRFLFSRKLDTVMRDATLVVCGNAYLAERAYVAGARRVEIVPTVIDLNRYTMPDSREHKEMVIGWIGSPSTVNYLELITPALRKVAAGFSVQLRVIGAPFEASGIKIDCRPWSEETEVSDILDFDIGIMPLRDTPWERGKCGYKLIQCMACGLPVIASPVGVNREIVQDGVNGYLATTTEEWTHAFRQLLIEKERRIHMGRQGRQAVEQRYCLQVTLPRIATLFREAARQGTGP